MTIVLEKPHDSRPTPTETERDLLARILLLGIMSLAELRQHSYGFTKLQRAWIEVYGHTFTAIELGILFYKEPNNIRRQCLRIGVTPKDYLPPLGQRERHMLKSASGGGGDPTRARSGFIAQVLAGGRKCSATAAGPGIRLAPATAPLRAVERLNFTPAELNDGWWLNNAILHKMGLRKMGPEGCSWIAGDPHQPGWTFCGARRSRASCYCEQHRAAAWMRQPKPEETNDGETPKSSSPAAKHVKDRSVKTQSRAKRS